MILDNQNESIKPKKKRKAKWRKRFKIRYRFFAFWVLIFITLIAFVIGQAGRYSDLLREYEDIQDAIAEVRAEAEQLDLQLTFFDSDAYIEQLARERLGMIRPNEIVFRNIAAE